MAVPLLCRLVSMTINLPLSLDHGGIKAGEFCCINDIAVSDRTGTIAVADAANKRIQLFSSDGKFKTLVELDGGLCSVVFTECGDLLTLVSENNNKLCLFSEEGQFIKHINDKHLLRCLKDAFKMLKRNHNVFPLRVMVLISQGSSH